MKSTTIYIKDEQYFMGWLIISRYQKINSGVA